MKALLAEDSRLARAEMGRLLSAHTDIEIAGEAATADEAEQFIADLRPDLLLLDIQMPGRDGFDLLASLDTAPLVIFCTAYGEFAVRAFEKNTLDYLGNRTAGAACAGTRPGAGSDRRSAWARQAPRHARGCGPRLCERRRGLLVRDAGRGARI